MTESGLLIDPPASLAALRSAGAQRLDPVRFHYLEVLSERLLAAPDEVQCILQGRLNEALTDYAERFKQARQAASDEVARLSSQRPDLSRELRRLFEAGDYRAVHRLGVPATCKTSQTPLAQLNQHIRSVTQGVTPHGMDGPGTVGRDPENRTEMKSLSRFRETWSKIAAEDQVIKAIGRRPQNAGPLNSHLLVLRSLALMRDLSPDYLQRFLSHLDSLLWLEQASQQTTAAKPKAGRIRS